MSLWGKPRVRRETRKTTTLEQLERRMLLSIIPAGGEFRVNNFTPNDQRYSAVAVDAAGRFTVVWESRDQDGSDRGIYAQRYNGAGGIENAEFRVNTYTLNDQSGAAIAMAPSGEFIVAWSSDLQDGSNWGVYAQRFDATGLAQGQEFRVNTYTSDVEVRPSVAMNAAGDFVIVWMSRNQPGDPNWGVFGQRYNADGTPKGDEFHVNSQTEGIQWLPTVAMDADGDFVVAWEHFNYDGNNGGVFAQRYNSEGIAQGEEFLVTTSPPYRETVPAITMDSNGDFVVAWTNYSYESGYDIYAQRYNSVGAPFGEEVRVNSITAGDQFGSSVGINATGNFVVVWAGSVGTVSGHEDVFAKRFNSIGVAQDLEFRANTYLTGSQAEAVVAVDPGGNVIVVWGSLGQDGSGWGIYAQRYAVVPAVTASSFLFDTAPQRLQFTFDENVSASLGTDDLIVENLTTGQMIPPDEFSLTYDSATNIATFTYIGTGGGFAGVLPDGNYRATLIASGITTPNGMPLPNNYQQNFFFLQADANHDGKVNLIDFNTLAGNFGADPATFSQGDFNYDGRVNLIDFNILAGRFGNLLAPQFFFATKKITDSSRSISNLLQDDLLA